MHTIRVPDIAKELHGGRHERVVLWELELGREHATFVRRALWSLYEGFPDKQIILVDGTGGDAIRRVGREVFVLLEEPLRGYGVHCALLSCRAVRGMNCLAWKGRGVVEWRCGLLQRGSQTWPDSRLAAVRRVIYGRDAGWHMRTRQPS